MADDHDFEVIKLGIPERIEDQVLWRVDRLRVILNDKVLVKLFESGALEVLAQRWFPIPKTISECLKVLKWVLISDFT